MNLTLVRKYNKLLRKTDGILLHNPLLTLGLGPSARHHSILWSDRHRCSFGCHAGLLCSYCFSFGTDRQSTSSLAESCGLSGCLLSLADSGKISGSEHLSSDF